MPNHNHINYTSNDDYRRAYREGAFLIVAGGRDFTEYDLMCSELDRLIFENQFCGECEPGAVKIISGIADGADTLAVRYADERGLTKILFPANWKFHHRIAGFLRNEDMMRLATHLVAFWDGRSHGTQHIIELAREKGIPYRVIRYKQEE